MSKSRTNLHLLLLVLTLPSAWSEAADIEIGPGDSLVGAISSLAPGDTLTLRAGTYNLTSRLAIDRSGTETAPITIRSAAGEVAVLQRPNANNNVIDIEQASFLVLDGLTITGGANGIGLRASSDIALRNLHIHNVGGAGITATFIGSNYARLTIERNTIHQTSESGEGVRLGCPNGACSVHHSVVSNNHIHSLNGPTVIRGTGIEISAGSHDNIVRDNVIHDVDLIGIFVHPSNGIGGDSIIERNIIWRTGDSALQVTNDVIVRNNVVLATNLEAISARSLAGQGVGNVNISNNTVLTSNGTGLSLRGVTGPAVLANNAIYSATGSAMDASGMLSQVQAVGNVGKGSLVGVTTGFDNTGDLAVDFGAASHSGAPPQDLVPRSGRLVGTGSMAHLPEDDFNGHSRLTPADVGAYMANAGGNTGWIIQDAIKTLHVFRHGFER